MADSALHTAVAAGRVPPKGGASLALGLVFGFLGLSVVVHAVAVTYALTSPQELGRSDYYEAGERHDRELAARRLGLDPAVRRGSNGALSVTLSGAPLEVAGAPATLRWQRPAAAAADRAVALAPTSVGAKARATMLAAAGTAASVGGVPEGQAGQAMDTVEARWHSAPLPAIPPGAWDLRLEVGGTHPVAVELAVHVDANGTVRARKRGAAGGEQP